MDKNNWLIFFLCMFICSILIADDKTETNTENNIEKSSESMVLEDEQISEEDISPQDILIEDALLFLEESKYEDALKNLEEVLVIEPDNAIALFLKGMVFIRIKRVEEGMKLLQKGKDLGADLSIYQLELGRGYFLSRKYPRAIAALSQYEEISPGEAETAKLLGYSYFFVKQFENSQKYLRLAVERGDEDTDALHYCLALCAMQLKQRKEMIRQTDAARNDDKKDSPFVQMANELHSLAEDYKVAEAEKPWWIQVQIGGGYDSNPRAFGDEIPGDVDQRYDWFISYSLRGEYHTKIGIGTETYIKGSFFGRKYLDLADVIDQVSFEGEIGIRHAFNDFFQIKAGVRNQYYLIDYDPFANDTDMFLGLTFFETDWMYSEFYYALSYRSFLLDINDGNDDLEGVYNEFNVSQAFYINPLKNTIKVGYKHLFANTKGANFDRNEGSLYFSVFGYIMKENYYGIRLEYRYRDFLNDNSVFDVERNDQAYYAQAFFSRKIFETLSIFFSYSYERNDSNLADFDYSRQVFTTGFLVNY